MVYGLLGFIAGTLFSALAGIAAAVAAYFLAGRKAVVSDVQSSEPEAEQQRERLKKQYENLMRYNGSSNNQVDIEGDWR